MSKKIKAFAALLALAGAVMLKLNILLGKLGALMKLGVVILALLHLSSGVDSSAIAKRPRNGKSPRQVAQANPQKPVTVEKVAGPMAPAPTSGPALTPSAPLGAGPIQAARNAAAAQNAQLASQTGQSVPTPGGTKTPPAAAPQSASPPPKSAAPAQTGQVVQQGAPKPTTTTAANNRAEPTVLREEFDYSRDTRRDPFVSLMTTSDLRPTLTDLRLTGILYDLSGRRPVAILRDIAGGQWRVTTGMTLGRMRVAQIKPKTIIFTIEEFGFNRQDSLILGDTTRVRHR
jgi:hypothetical protein